MPKKGSKDEPSGQADPQGDDKKWQATRESFVSGDGSSGAASSVTKDVLEATKGVDVDARKEALQIAGLSGEMAQESKALEDKLGMLKDQLSDLRTSIKTFETEFDARLDACLQSILSYKIGSEEGDTSGAN